MLSSYWRVLSSKGPPQVISAKRGLPVRSNRSAKQGCLGVTAHCRDPVPGRAVRGGDLERIARLEFSHPEQRTRTGAAGVDVPSQHDRAGPRTRRGAALHQPTTSGDSGTLSWRSGPGNTGCTGASTPIADSRMRCGTSLSDTGSSACCAGAGESPAWAGGTVPMCGREGPLTRAWPSPAATVTRPSASTTTGARRRHELTPVVAPPQQHRTGSHDHCQTARDQAQIASAGLRSLRQAAGTRVGPLRRNSEGVRSLLGMAQVPEDRREEVLREALHVSIPTGVDFGTSQRARLLVPGDLRVQVNAVEHCARRALQLFSGALLLRIRRRWQRHALLFRQPFEFALRVLVVGERFLRQRPHLRRVGFLQRQLAYGDLRQVHLRGLRHEGIVLFSHCGRVRGNAGHSQRRHYGHATDRGGGAFPHLGHHPPSQEPIAQSGYPHVRQRKPRSINGSPAGGQMAAASPEVSSLQRFSEALSQFTAQGTR